MATRRLDVANIKVGMVTGESIFTEGGHKLIDAGVSLTLDMIIQLKKYNISHATIFFSGSEINLSQKPKMQTGKEIESPPPKGALVENGVRVAKIDSAKARKTHEVSVNRTKEVFKGIKDGGNLDLKAMENTVESLIDGVMDNPQAFASLQNLQLKDEYTYIHSVDVCAYSILLAQKLGYNEEAVSNIALAALLHDVGKMLVPDTVLNKPGPLTDVEFAQMKKHSFFGYQILKRENIDERLANCVLEHHEREDGKGYPFGKRGIDTDDYSKIIAIADVYSALTVDRVYRKALPAFRAIKVIVTEGGGKVKSEYARTFQQLIGVYPNSTEVRLSDGSICRVIDQNESAPMRPVLQVVKDGLGKDTEEMKTIDLSERKDLFVKGINA